jgi:bifunctional DNase/RNase
MRPARRLAGLACLLAIAAACGSQPPAAIEDVAVEVGRVAVDRASGAPVVILEESGGTRSLPIWIGIAEAQSIAAEMEKQKPPRPNTHDLAKRLIDRLEGALQRVVVTELRGGTYYAVLFLAVNGEVIEVDARPSDAIAIALRCGAPVFVREALFEEAGRSTPPEGQERST